MSGTVTSSWFCRLTDPRTPRPLTESRGKIGAVLAGRPNDPTYLDDCNAAYNAIQSEGTSAHFHLQEPPKNRRGKYVSLSVGVSHGQGTTEPVNLKNTVHESMLDRLLSNKSIMRMAAFADGTLPLDTHAADSHSP